MEFAAVKDFGRSDHYRDAAAVRRSGRTHWRVLHASEVIKTERLFLISRYQVWLRETSVISLLVG